MVTKKNVEAEVPKVTGDEKEIYTVDEFVSAGYVIFGKDISPDIIRAAFKVAGIKTATVDKAKKLVKSFAEKEVK